MASKRLLLEFLNAQARNRTEQIKVHTAYRNPNAQLLGKMRNEKAMFEEVAEIVTQADWSPAPTATSEDFERQRLSTTKRLVPRDTPLTENGEPSLAAQPTRVSANGKRIGRPPKMTRAQIEAAGQGPAVAVSDPD